MKSINYSASLPMYDWPEVRSETLDFWRGIEQALAPLNLDTELHFPSTPQQTQKLWSARNLIFSQTCWGPLENGLAEYVSILAQPDYSNYLGGRNEFYRSLIVARKDADVDIADVPKHPKAALPTSAFINKVFAFNERTSLSGYLALETDLQTELPDVFASMVESGSHRQSIKLVSKRQADFAAIDCRSWSLALAHEPSAKDMKIVGWTQERLGLPFICSKTISPEIKSILKNYLETPAQG